MVLRLATDLNSVVLLSLREREKERERERERERRGEKDILVQSR